jgi:purine-binding chemotaxis protein CheW
VTGAASDVAATARILAERARALATPLEEAQTVDAVAVLLLVVGDEHYGIAVEHVVTIERAGARTPVPGLSPEWAGIANVHGTLHAILDLGRYLGAHTSRPASQPMIVVARGAGFDIGLLVDEVSAVTSLRSDALGSPPSSPDGRTLVRGVTTDRIALLDVEALFSDPRLAVNDDVS